LYKHCKTSDCHHAIRANIGGVYWTMKEFSERFAANTIEERIKLAS
tara:strand:+ start:350 stop:487 length:138 start_codon:yes stop_codon:yes gene_type:complete